MADTSDEIDFQTRSNPLIDPKHEMYCQEVANGMRQDLAYKAAFDRQHWKRSSASSASSKLMKDKVIKSRITFLREQNENRLFQKHNMTRDDLLDIMASIARDEDVQSSARVQAANVLLKMTGWDKPEDDGSESDAKVRSLITELDLQEDIIPLPET